MTRDEFVKALCLVYTREHGYLVAGDALFSSDTEQRRVIEQQAQQIAALREALQLLYDVQNGCPLPKYQKDWDRAMDLTQQALKEVNP